MFGERFTLGTSRLYDVCNGENRKQFQRPFVFADHGADKIRRRFQHELGWRAVLDDKALVHHGDTIRQMKSFVHIVCDENDRHAELLLDIEKIVLGLGADHRVQGAEGLVHQENVGFGGQRTRHADALLLAA